MTVPPGHLRPVVTGPAPWLVILAAALAVRLTFVALAPNELLWPDARWFEAVARSLLEDGTYGTQTLRAPGYPTLIAAVYAVLGKGLLGLRVVEAILGVLAVALVGLIGTRVLGRRAGLLAAALAALHPVLAFLPSIGYSENTLVLMVVLALGATFDAWKRPGTWRWATTGVLWGLALLTRPNVLLALPGVMAGLVLAFHRERRAWWAPALLCTATAVLTVAPWIVRNHRIHGEWYFIATGGGRQFWIGNNPRAEADSRVAGFFPDSAMQAELDRLPNQVALERYYYRKGAEFVRANPGRAAVLYLRELRNLFALYPETYTRRYINHWSRLAQGLASAAVLAGALLALGRLRSTPELWPLVGAVLSFGLGSAVYFTIMRYRLTVEPALLWMAGLGWSFALSRWIGSDAPPPRAPADAHLAGAGAP